MSSPLIEAFVIDDINESKFVSHGLYPEQVIQILDSKFVIVPNRRYRRGLYLLIGKDHGGAFITIPVESTPEKTVWRPITAWPSKQSEYSIYLQREGRK